MRLSNRRCTSAIANSTPVVIEDHDLEDAALFGLQRMRYAWYGRPWTPALGLAFGLAETTAIHADGLGHEVQRGKHFYAIGNAVISD